MRHEVLFCSGFGTCCEKLRPLIMLELKMMFNLSPPLVERCCFYPPGVRWLSTHYPSNTHKRVFVHVAGSVETDFPEEKSADPDPRVGICTICVCSHNESRPWNVNRTVDTWGLSEIGVDGNDRFRSSDFRAYNENISASRFELMVDGLLIIEFSR